MKKMLLTNWHFIRWVRLALFVGVTYHAINSQQYFLLIFAAFFLFQVVFNTCGTGSCEIPQNKKESNV